MRIDLHTHSRCSDGTDSPAELVQAGARAGLDVMAITDHDTIAGWAEAARAAACCGITLVRGMEISARYEGHSVHILAYLFDPENPALCQHIKQIRASRWDRAQQIVQRLHADFPITWDDVVAQADPEVTIGRPHIADALVKIGVVGERGQAFDELLHPSSRYYVRQYAPEAIEVIDVVKKAGGKTVWAHPKAVKRGTLVPDSAFAVMAAAGLFGVEVDHRDNPQEKRADLAAIVASCGLRAFGSSDYHGMGKPNRLGEHTTSQDVFEALTEGAYMEV